MRCFVLAAALLFSTSVFAEFTPDAVAMPKPLYPSGLGIACLPDFMVREALEQGALQQVLDEHLDYSGTFWILWPSSRHAAAKVRALIDHLSVRLFPEYAVSHSV